MAKTEQINLRYSPDFVKKIHAQSNKKYMKINAYIKSLIDKDLAESGL